MKIRVLVVDDSPFMRRILTDIIGLSDTMELVGIAKNGQEAIDKVKELRPDVVTLDIEMPVMDGITALKKIMKECPTRVIMLSSLTQEAAKLTVDALELGAIDFIPKPANIFKIDKKAMVDEITEKFIVASKTKLNKSYNVAPVKINKTKTRQTKSFGDTDINKIIAIGTSTGGPRALHKVIPEIPADINAGVVVVQHMPPKFTKSLADRLNNVSNLVVKEAEDREFVERGVCYIAPGDRHLLLKKVGKKYQIELSDGELVTGHKPSVDAMFYSIADIGINNVIGVILTGMGADGTKGLKRIKNEINGYVIAQDEASCVVYGMPKSAVNANVVDRICDLEQVPNEIIKAMEV